LEFDGERITLGATMVSAVKEDRGAGGDKGARIEDAVVAAAVVVVLVVVVVVVVVVEGRISASERSQLQEHHVRISHVCEWNSECGTHRTSHVKSHTSHTLLASKAAQMMAQD
jgi:hypothetical protein